MRRFLLFLFVGLSCLSGCASCGEPENNSDGGPTNVVTEGDTGSADAGDMDGADVDAAAPDMQAVDMYMPPTARLEINREELVLRRGTTEQLSVTILFDGDEYDAEDVAWTSADMAIATVDETGVVSAQDVEGHTEVTATTIFRRQELTATVDVAVIAPYVSVATGGGHTCGVTLAGTLFCWGNNSDSQLGPVSEEATRPRRSDVGLDLVSVAAGAAHTCGIDADGVVWCWGSNSARQVGSTTVGAIDSPVEVLGPGYRKLALGSNFSCALQEIPPTDPLGGAELHCWGSNQVGQLGTDAVTESEMPVRVNLGEGPTRWLDVGAGDEHACGVTTDGETYCWGDNRASQLGDPTMVQESSTPVLVSDQFSRVAAGGTLTCGLSEGAVFCWGRAAAGFGGTTESATPVEVARPMDTPASAIVLGDGFACASGGVDGTFCWGANDVGQLGDTTSDDRDTAEFVQGEAAFRQLSAGASHACGLNATGAIFCWGSNAFGQIGDDTKINRFRPVLVATPR